MISFKLLNICGLVLVLLAICPESSTQRALCGPALDAVLKMLCVHGYNTKFKRSMKLDNRDSNELIEEFPFTDQNSPFLGLIHDSHFNTLAKTRRRRQGVYDECCSKGCTYDEILSYCNRYEDLI